MQLCKYMYILILTWNILLLVVLGEEEPSYMGCYTDDESNRAMSIQTNRPTNNSVRSCVDFCRQNQYSFAGLENGVDCHCGEEFHKHGQSEACNVTCPGDHSAICGGKAALSIHSVCPPGVYGLDCQLPCPSGCKSQHNICQVSTGQCCQEDVDQSSDEMNCNYFRKTECGKLRGDPRPEVADMSKRAGYWFNLLTTMTFKVNAKVTSVKYFSRTNNGTVYVSFWRNIDGNATKWMMVGKLELKPKMEGLQERKLKPSESVYVRTGDATALHYPYGSGIIPYENFPAERSDLQGATFHEVLNTPQRGSDWTPGHVISFSDAVTYKRLAAIQILYDCIEECPDGYYGGDCAMPCGQCLGRSHCHFTDGSCPFGCAPGYTNPRCNQACEANTFGHNCQQFCSTSCKDDVCDHLTGTCTRGCKAGYSGEKCDGRGRSHLAIILVSIILPLVILLAVAMVLGYICFWKPWQQRKRMRAPKSTTTSNETSMMRDENGANNTAFEDPLLLNEQKLAYTNVEM